MNLTMVERVEFSSHLSTFKFLQRALCFLSQIRQKLPSKLKSPLPSNYRPKVDVFPELKLEEASCFQFLVGVLRNVFELGRADSKMETSVIESAMALPRREHSNATCQMLAFLIMKHTLVVVSDESNLDLSKFFRRDFQLASPLHDDKEETPSSCLFMRGIGFSTRVFVDSDHASDLKMHRHRTRFVIILNSAHVYWSSKKQFI